MEAIDYTKLLAPPGFAPTWREDLTDEQYHADKTAIGSGNLRVAMDSLKAFHGIMFEGRQKKETDEMILGRKIHMAILEREKFKRLHVVEPVFTGMTKDGKPTTSANATDVKEKRGRWLAELPSDAVTVTQDDLEMMIGIAESIVSHPQGKDAMKNAVPERAGYYMDPETGLTLKIKPDLIRLDGSVFIDLKSTKDSSTFAFGKTVYGEQRIDIQLFMYGKGIEAITGKFPKLIMVMAVEKVWPFEVAIYFYTREMLLQAETDYHATLGKIRAALDSGHWPMRQQKIQRGHVPEFFIRNSVEREDVAV